MQEVIKLVKWKSDILEKLNTKNLTDQLLEQMSNLSKSLEAESKFKIENRGFLASANDDCQEVKGKLAELYLECPPINANGAKSTASDKEAWLRQQRTANKNLAALITKQTQVLAGMEDFRIKTENISRKIEAILAIIRLKTAQIEFLSRSH
jgi:hypothetical protein